MGDDYYNRGTVSEWRKALRGKAAEDKAAAAVAACKEMLAECNADVPRETSGPCAHAWAESERFRYSLECEKCGIQIEHPKRTEYLNDGSNAIQRTD